MDEKLIEALIIAEWATFQEVCNIGGRASCQNDFTTFEIMRKSQFMAWNDELCASYLHDLIFARDQGRNLLGEKYARMMERTAAHEYERLRAGLPEIPEKSLALVDEIVAIQSAWQEEYAAEYPKLAARGRPQGRWGDLLGITSFATYLRGELLSYSPRTLELYAEHVRGLREKEINMNKKITEITAALYGYASLGEAEASL